MEEKITIGSRSGCLTVIDGLRDYQEEIEEELLGLGEHERRSLQSQRMVHTSQVSKEMLVRHSSLNSHGLKYKCRCKCGNIHYLSADQFLYKRYLDCGVGCGLIEMRKENRKKLAKREQASCYDENYENTVFESLEIIECIDDNYETFYLNKRSKRNDVCIIDKLYKCRCYICGKYHTFTSRDFKIHNDEYGERAQEGYYSDTHCDCHKISSFQWRTIQIFREHNINYRVEAEFPGLYGIGQQKLLRFDFAVYNSNGNMICLVECQGEQHYKPVEEFGGISQYEIQIKNDEIKRNYVEEEGLILIEIPYTCRTYNQEVEFLREEGLL